jgi:hypothetical protein
MKRYDLFHTTFSIDIEWTTAILMADAFDRPINVITVSFTGPPGI